MRLVSDRIGVAIQYPEFRRLWMANASSQAASWSLIVTRGWFIYRESESSFFVGLATFAAMGPMLIVPPIIGVLADRIDRRKILSIAYAADIIQSGVLVFLALAGVIEVWMVVALSLINGVSRATQQPTSQALAASLVPGERLLNALALNASTQHGAKLFGPGLVTPILAFGGASAAFFVALLLYVSALYSARQLAPQPPAARAPTGFLSDFVGGLAYVYQRPVLRLMLLVLFMHCGLTMAFESMLPGFADNYLRAGDEGFGSLMMGVGSGALIASLYVSGLQTHRGRGSALIIAGLASGLGMILLALTTSLMLGIIAAAIMGGGQAAFMAMGQAVTQSIAVDEFRGRVASINAFSLGGIMATMNLFNGSIADVFGSQSLLLIYGSLFTVILVLTFLPATGRQVYGRRPLGVLQEPATP